MLLTSLMTRVSFLQTCYNCGETGHGSRDVRPLYSSSVVRIPLIYLSKCSALLREKKAAEKVVEV